jgi:two-component system, OmpR family, sensor kinase
VKSRRPPGGPGSNSAPGRSWWARLRGRLHRTQLRTRVLVGVLAVTLIALASLGFATVAALHGYLLGKTDADLLRVLTEYQPMLAKADTPPARSANPGIPGKYTNKPSHGNTNKPAEGNTVYLEIPSVLDLYNVEFKTGQGPPQEVVQGNADLVPRLPGDLAALAARHRGQTVTGRNGHVQLRLLATSADGGTLIVTTSLESLDSIDSGLSVIVALGLLTAALLVFTGVGLVTRRGLRPVETMAAAADRITAGDLTSRVSTHDPATEVGRLGSALNGMLARIQAAVREREANEQATRQFFADASHELRTPLAALRANAELYQQGALPSRAQVDEAMRRIASEARRMGNLVDDMLRLARLDQHPHQRQAPVDLSALAAECAERARIASPERTWHACITPGLATCGDEEMLRRAIDNLLANVTIHTPPGTTAAITATAADDGAVSIEVSDDGPGVPAAQLPRIFDRFYRAPALARRPGSGLGLAIVAATAAAHHGTAKAMPRHPQGLRIILILPPPPSPAPPWQSLCPPNPSQANRPDHT